ncbi:polyphosphate kinase 2 [Maribacter polysiphoniae]|uniref:ADP/GDP-polyphosphate phosphotransferase n=1 Tax=Maribacter polysiphoniae TaxID=429344 RepID=A0A316E906_9FLAO|nr:polyphosphate kinase 2 [Maribacter polysiphoniae]MBD1262953.1 polyphosphate kinase 2 [Maribacter polysiphoniae]PWK19370.1 polyphosphate kinase 2 [Maribacter polysiphoniae]
MKFTAEDLQSAKTRKDLIAIAKKKGIDIDNVVRNTTYEIELAKLQSELVNLQQWITKKQLRVAVLFEGRDAAGKGGSIKRFREHLNPRSSRVVALSKPTDNERGQWYFRRYIKELPNPGEIVFFDRSWYNRAVVEPVMGFCSKDQYNQFMVQVPEFEHMLYEDGVIIIKFWFSISKEVQSKRFNARLKNPLKQWKFSPVDRMGQKLWDDYTFYKEQMFTKTHTDFSPWIIVKTNDKKTARLESMRYLLSMFDYTDKRQLPDLIQPDPNIIFRYYRNAKQIDI